MGIFGKAIYDSQDCGVTIGWRKASDEVQGDARPGARRNGERSEQASGRSMRRISPGADRAGCHKLSNVPIHGGPPEALSEEVECPSLPRWHDHQEA